MGNPPEDIDFVRSKEEPLFPAGQRTSGRRLQWASLLQRVFEIEALRCPRCGCSMRLIAAIEDPVVARNILECLSLPSRGPPLEPVVADPDSIHFEDDRLFDQSANHDEHHLSSPD